MKQMKNWLRRGTALLAGVLLAAASAGCHGGDDPMSSQDPASSAGGSTSSGDFTLEFPEETPNPPVRIPAAPEKPEEKIDSAFGQPAPKWMREAEMYQEYSNISDEDQIREWAPYFSMMLGTPWNSTTSLFNELGLKSGQYFDPYHVFTNTDIAVMDQNGNPVQSDYIEPGRNDLYVVCHNCPDVIFPWARNYIDTAMSFGATGMFFDDIREPYANIAAAYNTCYSKNHEHTLSGTNSSNYFTSTLPELHRYVKSKNSKNFVILNGGMPLLNDAKRPDTMEKLWPYTDALMWEHAIYDANTVKWTSWDMLESAASKIKQGIQNGKVELLLSYSYEKMSKEKALEAAVYTIAYCRMYDICWSDYYSLYRSSMDRSLLKELYGIKTGAAGQLGTYFGHVVDEESGVALSGVTVACGDQKVVTDANGAFSITMPAGKYEVELSRPGYETVTRTVTGYRMSLSMKKNGEGTVYYVAPYGSNDNEGTSSGKPWRSLNYGDAKKILKPGDTVVVAEGQYTVPNETNYNCSGTADNPITYLAQGDVRIRAAKGEGIPFKLNGSYQVWDGFRFEGSETGVRSLMQLGGDGIEIKNCTFSDTAYFNAEGKLASESAVTIRGKDAFFHHNVLGRDIYAPAALQVETDGIVRILNNTFDGTLTAGGKAPLAVKLAAAGEGSQAKNNIFSRFDKAFDASISGVQYASNLYQDSTVGTDSCVGDGDVTGKTPGFMWQPTGDYDLRSDGAAVNAGTDVGFAYQGKAPDIGAYESRYNRLSDEQEEDEVIYRTFADSVVLINTNVKAEQTVTIPLGRAKVTLREVGYGRTWTTDGNGNLTIAIPADGARILKVK